MIRNYFTKDIQVKDKLREYRTVLNQKYPDPQKKPKAEESDQGSSRLAKAAPGKMPAPTKQGSQRVPTPNAEVASAESKKQEEEKDDDSESDSVIQEADELDFTRTIRHMKGTPLPTKLADKLREEAVFDPSSQLANALRSSYISNTSAKKTRFQSNYYMMDYSYKEENIL